MITLDTNNFGGASVTLRDFQSSTLCVLSGKITVDPAHSSYMAATRLELDLPVGFTMVRSAISNAILVSNAPIYRYGTVLQCWIEDNRLCIEKLALWDTFGPYEIYINAAFVTRCYRGEFLPTTLYYPSVLNTDQFGIGFARYVDAADFVYYTGRLSSLPDYDNYGQGPFTVLLSGFATDVLVEIPLIVHGVLLPDQKGSMITIGSFENGNLTFSYQEGAVNLSGKGALFNFFALRGSIY